MSFAGIEQSLRLPLIVRDDSSSSIFAVRVVSNGSDSICQEVSLASVISPTALWYSSTHRSIFTLAREEVCSSSCPEGSNSCREESRDYSDAFNAGQCRLRLCRHRRGKQDRPRGRCGDLLE